MKRVDMRNPVDTALGLVPMVVEQTLDRDHFMSADEALDWGLVDKVITTREAAEGAQAD